MKPVEVVRIITVLFGLIFGVLILVGALDPHITEMAIILFMVLFASTGPS